MPEAGDDGGELRVPLWVRPGSAAEQGGICGAARWRMCPLLCWNGTVPQLQTPPAAGAVSLTVQKNNNLRLLGMQKE